MTDPEDQPFTIAVVGPCSSGKSELVERLRACGYTAKQVMQEHSIAPAMWRHFGRPDILVYLDVDPWVAAMREGLAAPSSWWVEERELRLADARANCDLYIDTSSLTPKQVLDLVLDYLCEQQNPSGTKQ